MAHRRTYSSRYLDMDKVSFDTPPLTPPLAVFNQFQLDSTPTRKTRQYWQRTTFLALFALVLVSGYVLLISQPSLSPIAMQGNDSRSFTGIAAQRLSRLSSEAYRLAALHRKRPQGTTSSPHMEATTDSLPPLQLTPSQELAAVTSFLASLPQNVIPSNVDPSLPIDPQLVLDFDTRTPQAIAEVAQLEHDAWVRYPVVLYSKVRVCRAVALLHAQIFTDALTRLTRIGEGPARAESSAWTCYHPGGVSTYVLAHVCYYKEYSYVHFSG